MKTKKALLCLGAAATLFFYGCESKDNNGISSADSSGSVITTAVQNTVPTAKLPDYSESSYTRPSYGNYAFTRKRESLRLIEINILGIYLLRTAWMRIPLTI